MFEDEYEKGYKDGESSGYADWLGEIQDHFPDEGITGPQSLIRWMKRTKNTIRVKPIAGKLVNEEPITLLVTATGIVTELSLDLHNYVIDVQPDHQPRVQLEERREG